MIRSYTIPTRFGELHLLVVIGIGRLVKGLKRARCSGCNRTDCGIFSVPCTDIDDEIVRAATNGMLDAVESMVMAHAIAGIEVESESYVRGVHAALRKVHSQK